MVSILVRADLRQSVSNPFVSRSRRATRGASLVDGPRFCLLCSREDRVASR